MRQRFHKNSKGYQVLSFDLPEHGDRKNEATPCKVQNCVKDLAAVMEYAKQRWPRISLFAVSMGAYFSLLAYGSEPLEHAWFLSPVVDMERIIDNMLCWFQITEEQLKSEQTIPTPIGQTLYWDYYCYIKEHPIKHWNVPTNILYGSKDDMCEKDIICQFSRQFSCQLEIVEGAEHYFHTPTQLQTLSAWLEKTMQLPSAK
ncbi:alpha/beta hydrolase [Anaerovorax odorimutans]|uniref:Alpha/beta hydrolase n=2 Tax=Anaerovorax odorimutans TaxID=109327 RepID=A0ABT1RSJ3_9FIRM|nr:alpha/beta hydrolase [Anaerovorax odorimutans]